MVKFMQKKLAAEAFGTFWLVFGGCGSAVLAAGVPDVGIGYLGVALAFGFPTSFVNSFRSLAFLAFDLRGL